MILECVLLDRRDLLRFGLASAAAFLLGGCGKGEAGPTSRVPSPTGHTSEDEELLQKAEQALVQEHYEQVCSLLDNYSTGNNDHMARRYILLAKATYGKILQRSPGPSDPRYTSTLKEVGGLVREMTGYVRLAEDLRADISELERFYIVREGNIQPTDSLSSPENTLRSIIYAVRNEDGEFLKKATDFDEFAHRYAAIIQRFLSQREVDDRRYGVPFAFIDNHEMYKEFINREDLELGAEAGWKFVDYYKNELKAGANQVVLQVVQGSSLLMTNYRRTSRVSNVITLDSDVTGDNAHIECGFMFEVDYLHLHEPLKFRRWGGDWRLSLDDDCLNMLERALK